MWAAPCNALLAARWTFDLPEVRYLQSAEEQLGSPRSIQLSSGRVPSAAGTRRGVSVWPFGTQYNPILRLPGPMNGLTMILILRLRSPPAWVANRGKYTFALWFASWSEGRL